MDFWTGFPYWGILLLVLTNAFIVSRMDFTIEEEEEES